MKRLFWFALPMLLLGAPLAWSDSATVTNNITVGGIALTVTTTVSTNPCQGVINASTGCPLPMLGG